jgi:hypothetical protein
MRLLNYAPDRHATIKDFSFPAILLTVIRPKDHSAIILRRFGVFRSCFWADNGSFSPKAQLCQQNHWQNANKRG